MTSDRELIRYLHDVACDVANAGRAGLNAKMLAESSERLAALTADLDPIEMKVGETRFEFMARAERHMTRKILDASARLLDVGGSLKRLAPFIPPEGRAAWLTLLADLNVRPEDFER